MTKNGHNGDARIGPVGIVGLGVVGATVAEALIRARVETRGYDSYKSIGTPAELSPCGVVFICVPTPSSGDGSFDVSEVWAAIGTIEPVLAEGTIVAVKSTVPPGTSARLAAEFPRLDFASVPEFLVEARPMETLNDPDRVIVGASSAETAATVAGVMARLAPRATTLVVRPSEAELIKLCSNAMLAAKVTLANELALICEQFGVDWTLVQEGVGMDRRIGPDHLGVTSERGFGGKCLPKDLEGLIVAAEQAGYEAPVLREISAFNRAIRRSTELATSLGADLHS